MLNSSHLHKFLITTLLVGVTQLTGCSLFKPTPKVVTRYSEQVGGGAQKVEDRVLSLKKYQDALVKGNGTNELRLVQVFRREGIKFPQYRIFDVKKGSPYEVLGIEDGDVLLAANDRIVYDPAVFRDYVTQYILSSKDASLTISRAGVTIVFRYRFA